MGSLRIYKGNKIPNNSVLQKTTTLKTTVVQYLLSKNEHPVVASKAGFNCVILL